MASKRSESAEGSTVQAAETLVDAQEVDVENNECSLAFVEIQKGRMIIKLFGHFLSITYIKTKIKMDSSNYLKSGNSVSFLFGMGG